MVSQGSAIGSLLFRFFVNGLPGALEVLTLLFVDYVKFLLHGHRTWTFTTLLLSHGTGHRNGAYQSIGLSATTSQLAEKSTWDCPFPRWVWHPHSCMKNNQGTRGSGIQCILPLCQCTEAANKARRLTLVISRSFQDLSKSAFILPKEDLVRPHLDCGIPACLPNLMAI